MATKEDILEQVVGEYLIHQGYFVRHNIKFLPRKNHPDWVRNQDSNHSDIDVIGYHPRLEGYAKVVVVSCKSWQGGFNPKAEIRDIEEKKTRRGREAWKGFRELCVPKWSEAFRAAVEDATMCRQFTYVTACANVSGDRAVWENYQPFREAIGGNPLKLITFREMVEEILRDLKTTLAATEVGRMLQMFNAAGIAVAKDSSRQ